MNLCDYGCGNEGKYYFKRVKKWCCEDHYSKCPKMKISNKTKIIFCYICKSKIEVKINSGKYTTCNVCKEQGLKVTELEIAKERRKNTCIRKYEVENVSELNSTQEKRKETWIEKYGVNNPSKVEEFKEKRKETFIRRFGVDSPLQNKDVLEKMKNTNLERYGVEFTGSSEEIKEKMLTSKFIRKNEEVLQFFEDSNFKILDDYEGCYTDCSFKCKTCNSIFITRWNYIQQGYKCPVCYPRKNKSIAEEDIIRFLEELGFDRQQDFICGSYKIIPPYQLDIYIPSLNIAIEYNGLYWHNEHNKDINYHINKTNLCKEKGIRLIHIFEDEWVFKKDIVESKLIQILKKNKHQVIYVDKCTIKEIDFKIKNEFLENYHIQGQDNSIINLGAFYNNELVSCMTFSKEDSIWNLNRFCTNYNYNIPEVSSKLLDHFKTNYQWKEIISYADLRWSKGDLYYNLGFEFEKQTQPNYWYLDKTITSRIHRLVLKKRLDEPKDITECELRLKEGYSRIWDCGNLKFRLEKKEI